MQSGLVMAVRRHGFSGDENADITLIEMLCQGQPEKDPVVMSSVELLARRLHRILSGL